MMMMKRTLFFFLVLPVLLLAGCQNEFEEFGGQRDSGLEAGEAASFTATIEGGAMTKTLLAGQPGGTRPVHWAADDSVWINGWRYNVTPVASDSTTATLSPAGAMAQKDTDGKYKAWYPKEIWNNGGTPTLPATQVYQRPATLSTGVYPVIAHMPMYAESTSTRLDFKNLCAMLNFRLTGTDKVTKVEVVSQGKALWGPFSVVSDAAVIDPSVTAAANRKVTLDCGTSGVQLNATTPTDFFVAIPQGDYPVNDLTVTVYAGARELVKLTNESSILNAQHSCVYELGKDANVYESMRMVLNIKNPSGGTIDYWCTFRLPFANEGASTGGGPIPTDLIIDWGDGTTTTLPKGTGLTDSNKTHRYPDDARGEYTITITSRASAEYMADETNPRIPRFSFANTNEAGKVQIEAILDPILHYESTTATNTFKDLTALKSVCGRVFSKNPQIINMVSAFENTESLSTIPADLFEGLENAENFNKAFYDSYVGTLPEGLFAPAKKARTFSECFFGCGSLKTIPAGLFKGLADAENFYQTFCESGIERIPSDLFEGCTSAKSFSGTFQQCKSLVGPVPAGLFEDCNEATTFENTFYRCDALIGSIPAGLFKGKARVKTFKNTFYGCKGLTGAIPADLFEQCGSVATFERTFMGCRNLSGVLSRDLFKDCTQNTTFYGTFMFCSHLAGLEAGLFDAPGTNVKTFEQTFRDCYRLAGSPAGLFSQNTNVETFSQTFYNCFSFGGDQPIPADLFKGCTEVKSFHQTFSLFDPWSDPLENNGLAYPTLTWAELGRETIPEFLTSVGMHPFNDPAEDIMDFLSPNYRGEIPGTLFEDCGQVETFHMCFGNCRYLTGGIPASLFNGKSACTTFAHTFYNCVRLDGIIEPGLFDGCTSAENFIRTFCETGLSGNIPAGLFKDTKGDQFYRCFSRSSSLTGDIPANLFKNCPGGGHETGEDFFGCFMQCTGLGTGTNADGTAATGVIPAGLFADCVNATSFSMTFRGCGNLKTIGAGLFDKCTEVTRFGATFAQSGITEVPAGLFDNCTKVTTFWSSWGGTSTSPASRGIFDSCTNLTTVPTDIFAKTTAATDYKCAFYGCTSLTALPLPPNWSSLADNGKTAYCYNCTAASNYLDPVFDGPARNNKN